MKTGWDFVFIVFIKLLYSFYWQYFEFYNFQKGPYVNINKFLYFMKTFITFVLM